MLRGHAGRMASQLDAVQTEKAEDGQDGMALQRKYTKTREPGEFVTNSLACFSFSVKIPDGITPLPA